MKFNLETLLSALHAFHFLRPWWLLALLALPVLYWLWWLGQWRANVWRGVVDAHLLAHLQVGGGRRQTLALVGSFLVWVMGTLALAGPTWHQDEQPLWQTRAPLVIALDLSASISANDLPPSRLLQARAKLSTLLHERAGGQVALVAYAGEPFTVAPLTDDASNVALFLDALDPSVMPVPGNDAGKAIVLAQSLMRQAGFEHGQILLLTDHADADAESAARQALSAGYTVSALGMGTEAGAAYRDLNGEIGRAKLDVGSLQQLAGAGGGNYQPLTPGDADLKALGVLEPQSDDAHTAKGEKGTIWRDQGYWLLPLVMLLCLFAFRRGGALAVLALCIALPISRPAAAVDLWTRADQKAHQRIEQGAQAYRKGDFAAAQSQFSEVDSADGLYNQGNALAKQGKYDQAIAAYDAALKKQPGMADAIANRAAVEAARKQQQQGGQGGQGANQGQQKNQQQGNQQGGKSQQQSGQGNQGADKDAQSGQDNSTKQPSPQDQGSSSESKPESSQSAAEQQRMQQAANEAQRKKIEQAMQQESQAQNQPQPGQLQDKSETPAQREQRQATEAWLRRVPDDPGGLLKAKFELEYQRRQKDAE